jgi:hypothetical protein
VRRRGRVGGGLVELLHGGRAAVRRRCLVRRGKVGRRRRRKRAQVCVEGPSICCELAVDLNSHMRNG